MGELVRDQHVFGGWQAGNANQPALVLESVHHLKKWVAGRPLVRPWWWFDPAISGEAMADVGTHLADLAIGFIAPSQAVDYRSDMALGWKVNGAGGEGGSLSILFGGDDVAKARAAFAIRLARTIPAARLIPVRLADRGAAASVV